MSSTDASLLQHAKNLILPKCEADEIEKVRITGIGPDEDYYDMSHEKRGVALIFNHMKFDDPTLGVRHGTNKDRDAMTDVLKGLGFEVDVYDDLKYGQLGKILDAVSKEDHSSSDCLVVVVMSHGDTNLIHAKDTSYLPEKLWTPFMSCETLATKPKLFFVQACRGSDLDPGVRIEIDGGKPKSYVLPSTADILVMYSSFAGHYSFRSPSEGSWFVQSLCKELKSRAGQQDLLTILTFVNRTITKHESNVPTNRDFDKKKQIGSIVSSLTRILKF